LKKQELDLEPLTLFLQEKPVRAILTLQALGPTYTAVLAREIETTFPHALKILGRLEEKGIIVSHPDKEDGRIKTVEITPAGSKVADTILELIKAIKTCRQEKERQKEKIEKIKNALEKIQKELPGHLEGQDLLRLKRRLGPYNREIRKIAPIPEREELENRIKEIIETSRKPPR